MDSKKLGAIVIVAIIVVAVGVFLKGKFGDPDLPPEVRAKMQKKVDVDNLDVVELMQEDWEKLGSKDGKYKNPNTGNYTMVAGMPCASCGELIPAPAAPPRPDMSAIDPRDRNARDKALLEYQRLVSQEKASYLCPRCGDPAYGMGPGMGN